MHIFKLHDCYNNMPQRDISSTNLERHACDTNSLRVYNHGVKSLNLSAVNVLYFTVHACSNGQTTAAANAHALKHLEQYLDEYESDYS